MFFKWKQEITLESIVNLHRNFSRVPIHLTPQSRILLQKVMSSQNVKFAAFYGSKSLPLYPILNPISTLQFKSVLA